MHLIALLLPLLFGVPEQSWSPTAITRGHVVKRVTVFREGWDRGNEAYVLPAADARRLYALMAGNRLLLHTCGYHWTFAFEYADGTLDLQGFNQECETFREHSNEIRRIAEQSWKRARRAPTHATFEVKAGEVKTAGRVLGGAGYIVLEPLADSIVIAVRRPVPHDLAKRIRRLLPSFAKISPYNS